MNTFWLSDRCAFTLAGTYGQQQPLGDPSNVMTKFDRCAIVLYDHWPFEIRCNLFTTAVLRSRLLSTFQQFDYMQPMPTTEAVAVAISAAITPTSFLCQPPEYQLWHQVSQLLDSYFNEKLT